MVSHIFQKVVRRKVEFYKCSRGLGCGAYYNGQLVYFPWPNHWHQSNIIRDVTFLELIPVVLSVVIWGKYWITTTKILIDVDNISLLAILNKQTSKDKSVMGLIRSFVWHAMKHNIIFRAVYIAGSNNDIPDVISRKQSIILLILLHFFSISGLAYATSVIH